MFTQYQKRIWIAVAVVALAGAGCVCAASAEANPADSDRTATTAIAAVEFASPSLARQPEIVPLVNTGPALSAYTIRRTVPEVRIQFTVADERGRLLQSLSGSDFRILDNRIAVSGIRQFSRLNDLPLEIGILIDVSDSVQKTVQTERQAAQFLIQHVFRPDTDRAVLLAFSGDLRMWQTSTGDRDALRRAVSSVAQSGYATYLYDSLIRACEEQFPLSQAGQTAQRVFVLITDGDDTGSLHTLAEAISAAERREVQIFALSVHSPKKPSQADAVLQRLADATGGQFYVAAGDKDFPVVFSAMQQQMRTQYSVSFQPAQQTSGFHDVKIEMADGTKARIRARQGYFYDAP